MLDWVYESDARILYPLIMVVMVGASWAGARIGRRIREADGETSDIATLAGAILALFGLLLAFSFSLALSRYDANRMLVLEEANAIGSTANFALMLPEPTQQEILNSLRDYSEVRIGFGVPHDAKKLAADTARSLDLQEKLWQRAVAIISAAPRSLPVHSFVTSLNEMNNIHERRLAALRYHVPSEIMLVLIGLGVVAVGFASYHGAAVGSRRRATNIVMSATLAVMIMLVVDLDRPARGLITVSVQSLVDAAQGIPR